MSDRRNHPLLSLALWCSFVVNLPAHGQSSVQDCPSGAPGRWSAEAVDLCTSEKDAVPDFTRKLRIPSPDGRTILRVDKTRWWLERSGKKIALEGQDAYVTYPAEIGWSPDSKAFYITQSDGHIAGFRTIVFQLVDDAVRILNINRLIQRRFNHTHKCGFYDNGADIGDEPNVSGFKWIDGAKSLVVVAEVPPHGLCKDPGYFEGYLVSISDRRVISHYTPQQIVDRWGRTLGERLQGDFKSFAKPLRSIGLLQR